jgi:hypothetical protein
MLAPCRECGFDPADLSDRDLADEIRRLGTRYTAPLTRLLPGEDTNILAHRPAPEVWSALEYAAHVRDVLALFARRVSSVLGSDHPSLEVLDHDHLVEAGHYRDLDPGTVATQVRDAADQLAARISSLTDRDWERWGTRAGDTRTVREIAQRAVHEGRHHLLDIGRVLRAARGR